MGEEITQYVGGQAERRPCPAIRLQHLPSLLPSARRPMIHLERLWDREPIDDHEGKGCCIWLTHEGWMAYRRARAVRRVKVCRTHLLAAWVCCGV